MVRGIINELLATVPPERRGFLPNGGTIGQLKTPEGNKMKNTVPTVQPDTFPGWVPKAAQNYISHTKSGHSIRKLAKGAGCHASTVMRQVQKLEARRDDPLVDEALSRLGAIERPLTPATKYQPKDCQPMTKHIRTKPVMPSNETIEREGRRILRRLCEPSACLAIAKDMEKAVVVREVGEGKTKRTAVVERGVAQAMALKDWIKCDSPGRISRYYITGAGRSALKRLLADDDAARAGFAEAPAKFGDQHRDWAERDVLSDGRTRRLRYNCAESPVSAMARRKDKSGKPFLSDDLVGAAERLREDFELAQMGPRVAQNWDRFLSGGDREFSADSGVGDAPSRARERVSNALRDLGPGLGDVALRVCCFLEGLEAAEKRMGWSARSGKVVLRIALQRLKLHYENNKSGAMIG